MRFGVYSIRDTLVGYLMPVFEQSDAVAMRNFEYAVRKDTNNLSMFPNNYTLYKIGYFDSETGVIENIVPEHIADATSFVVKG